MIEFALKHVPEVRVHRTVASPIDTVCGILGELAFAEYFFGDWRRHRIGSNKGTTDFDDFEIKTSAFPFNDHLHLLVRADYARKRKPRFYVQIIIDVPAVDAKEILSGTDAVICGFATAAEIDSAPRRDFGSKFGVAGGYECHYIPIGQLHPMTDLPNTLKE